MKVLALIQGPDHVCYRYRIEALAWAVAERGLYLEAAPLRKGAIARVRQFLAARQADVVILQRRLLPIWQLALLRRFVPRLIYDVDDAVFQRDSYNPKGPESRVRMARFWATVHTADAVIVGNDYLRERTAAFVEPHRVRVIPTCIEPKLYQPASHRRTGSRTRLVWIGQHSTLASLQCAQKHLAAAARRLPGLELRLICDRSVDLSSLRVTLRRWSIQGEAAELAEGDIGINWLPDDSWSPGKCGLKVLQYMAAGLPVVANPVGMNCRMVIDGQTGFLASTPGQWAEAVARLAADPELRRTMGAAGRRLIERQYSVSDWGPRLAEVVAAVASDERTLPEEYRRENQPRRSQVDALPSAPCVPDEGPLLTS
ncbi:MAG TPA: glycosyltransferase family 4 protein [Thermoguttaceae bacterium]|nr:glycosyltransferase family 4 protein [Thermoguttaceae bacterium]